jgi:hypothetical protein
MIYIKTKSEEYLAIVDRDLFLDDASVSLAVDLLVQCHYLKKSRCVSRHDWDHEAENEWHVGVAGDLLCPQEMEPHALDHLGRRDVEWRVLLDIAVELLRDPAEPAILTIMNRFK